MSVSSSDRNRLRRGGHPGRGFPWIPPGLAHGFLVLSEAAEFLYKTTDYYAPEMERCLRWDDPRVNIAWPLNGRPPQLSAKDMQGLALDQL